AVPAPAPAAPRGESPRRERPAQGRRPAPEGAESARPPSVLRSRGTPHQLTGVAPSTGQGGAYFAPFPRSWLPRERGVRMACDAQAPAPARRRAPRGGAPLLDGRGRRHHGEVRA